MKKFVLLSFLLCLCGFARVNAQVQVIPLDATANGTTVQGPGAGMSIYDDGGSANNYGRGYDYHITVEGQCSPDSNGTMKYLCFDIIEPELDISKKDTLYIYDGPDIQSPLLLKINNNYRSAQGSRFYVSARNTSGKLTLRFRSSSDTVKGRGFCVSVDCGKPCEFITPVIDSMFVRYDLRTYDSVGVGYLRQVPELIDTTFYYIDTIRTDSIISIDTLSWQTAALLCQGQGVIFRGHGEYTHNTGYYNPTDQTSMFYWHLGAIDTVFRKGATQIRYGGFQATECNDVTLSITDSSGCASSIATKIQVRVAQNPVKTIYDLSAICNDDSLGVNVGYDGDNGTLTLKKITYAKVVTKVNEVRTFIPDGPPAVAAGFPQCYEAPVLFTEFPNMSITSASDICSICINYEHSYMGDYRIAIRCPLFDDNVSQTNYQAVLKYGKNTGGGTDDPIAPSDSPDGGSAGGSTLTGWPLDGAYTTPGGDGSPVYDSLQNPFGVGLDYCWSRNGQYTLVTGDPADVPTHFQPGNWYISSSGNTITSDDPTYFQGFTTIPAYFTNGGGQTPAGRETTRKPSDHAGMTDYYSPASDFSELIGCPMNGEWKAVICDFWGSDNGWIFNWAMDICGVSSGGGCEYQVGLDSVIWSPDTNYATDFVNGRYRGLRINKHDASTSYISSPDTAGDFHIKLKIYDEFGCVWDTATNITSVYKPRPNLGPDTLLCSVNSMPLDATDENPNNQHYSYTWEPYGETTGIIETHTNTGEDVSYIVEVTNREKNVTCATRDTIKIAVNDQPIPNFDPGQYPLEGCEPLTVHFKNTTKYGYKYRWVFGDGDVSTQKEPTHSFAAGQYDFKYYVESERGCKDSLIYDKLVTVFPNPSAAFSWDPVYPTVVHPSIQLENRTTPDDGSNKYFWEIQYNRDNPYSVHTLVEDNPSFEWTASNGEDISGSYAVRLIARTDNAGPSGKLVHCADTVENTILLINDFLQFPSVVTPNGDGINDRFVIKNLVEGLGYPNNTLDIYDKWGSRVFHTENITKDEDFWDPAATRTPAGTYFYRFSGKGYNGNIERNGVVEILK